MAEIIRDPRFSAKALQDPIDIGDNEVETEKRTAMDSYSKNEVDLKLEILEQRIENKYDRLMHQIEAGFQSLHADMAAIRTDIGWVKNQRAWLWYPVAVGFLLIAAGFVVDKFTPEKPTVVIQQPAEAAPATTTRR